MGQFFRDHAPILVALGAGVVIGTSVTVLYNRYGFGRSRELFELSVTLDRLRREVESLKKLIEETLIVKKKKTSGYVSVRTSSGEDDDDDFEEAIGE